MAQPTETVPGNEKHVIREYRIVLPMSVEQYNVGQLWSVAEASKNETGGGEGVEVKVNEPFDYTGESIPPRKLEANGQVFNKGQYTHKIFYLSQKVPAMIRLLAPKGSLEFHEKAWNAYPYCRTEVSNGFMKDNFYIVIESFHASDAGDTPNIHGLTGRDEKERQVIKIDVANDKVASKDYKPEWDPCLIGSHKANRSPLPKDGTGEWMHKVNPVMTCYKVVKFYFKWWGLQDKVEKMAVRQYLRLFTNFHRQVVCWQDNYHGLTMDDIRKLEDKTKTELEKQRNEGEVRGTMND